MKKKVTARISSLSLDQFYNVDIISFAENLYISAEGDEKVFLFENLQEAWEELLQEEYIN
jgi:hypothetical protein